MVMQLCDQRRADSLAADLVGGLIGQAVDEVQHLVVLYRIVVELLADLAAYAVRVRR